MPANLPAKYFEIEQKYRREKNITAKVTALQEMLAVMPKHKGTDHLKADLRAKISRLLQQLERPRATSKGQPEPFSIRRDGIGQAVLIGLSNAGKSQLLLNLTGATVKVGDYSFTTQIPQPGMVRFENILIQVVDTPAINDHEMQTRLFSLLRNADLLLVVVDLSHSPADQTQEVFDELERWGYVLLTNGDMTNPSESRVQKPVMVVGTKCDANGAVQGLENLDASIGKKFTTVSVSSVTGVGKNHLVKAIYQMLNRVRVYTKAPGGKPDFDDPIVLPKGGNLLDAAQSIHKDWDRKLKYALLWGSGKFDGQRIGRRFVLSDEDVIEFHD